MPYKLRAAGAVLRLVGMAPGLLFRVTRGYRAFRHSFDSAAAAEGMPREMAEQLARALRPSHIFTQYRKM